MATGKGLICKLGTHIEIPGADRIVQVDMFGETIITQKSNEEGTIGILFDMETCLSHEYASVNNMYRHSNLNVDRTTVGYLEDDRRIRPVRLKGVKCSGLFMPIYSVLQLIPNKKDLSSNTLGIGIEVNEVAGVKICEKYISKSTRKAMSNKEGKVKQNLVPTFKEHIDTDQWSRNSHRIKEGDLVIITEKLHGTSGRCGLLPVDTKSRLSKWKLWIDKLVWGKKAFYRSYQFVVGSRRVVKSVSGNEAENKAHFYDEDLWTKVAKGNFENKLRKGETVYFEIVGYSPSGELIMPSVSNKKLEKFLSKEEYKEFINRYGATTTFNYGCLPTNNLSDIKNSNLSEEKIVEYWGKEVNQYKVFVYRITMTNEDGDSLDLSWEQVKTRCEKLGVNHVPELGEYFIFDRDYPERIAKLVEHFTNKESKEFPQHIREGVCIRVENGGMTPLIFKNKSFIFKVLDSIIKDSDIVDMEDSQK